ncbi:type I-F CRISPR-associated endoribonuclease Cas6/Csy4 [Parachitinimonas caeni]|uniref:Type I-F CRISPR-associated endoribonuclease Cas6/Csy4 n=1 Tax=Parachitinimonas caeni TaxID=3031301 RepID=A0ABT7E1Q0_9NEIS|nr:type I-F CRISPR-associated endoribonuclease Cas6/Csy4 [Parachitinimonas caeni]MDK2126246.1 type I-F CRISPR-associated endoribonuclease Cas6/Csy4 [Parachitinimonas caeni]
MRNQYVDIFVREPTLLYELHGRLLAAVHGLQTEDAALAVAFPGWKDAPGEFGPLFRVFSAQASLLQDLIGRIRPLTEQNWLYVLPIQTVPDHARTICFARDRANDCYTSSKARRLQRRNPDWVPTQHPRELSVTHVLPMQSASNQQSFQMRIKRKRTAQLGGHQYGLGLLVPDF